MKVLLTGATGQLGQALKACKPESIKLISTDRLELDLKDSAACRSAIEKHRPDWVINAGAYTAVDKAESEPELAYAVNAEAPNALSIALKHYGGKMLQLSTDFVFDGTQSTPYTVNNPRNPLSIYGKSKAYGEEFVEKNLFPDHRAVILRTSWVMGPVGNNFALKMLRLHKERKKINVVADQVGSPTSTPYLANTCWCIVQNKQSAIQSVMHWTDAGAATWYDICEAVGEIGQELCFIEIPAKVNPIKTVDFPTTAIRPSYSILDCSVILKELNLRQHHWRRALKVVLRSIQGY